MTDAEARRERARQPIIDAKAELAEGLSYLRNLGHIREISNAFNKIKSAMQYLDLTEAGADFARSELVLDECGLAFDEKEKRVIAEISQKQELRPATVIKRALATYQLLAEGTHEMREVNPSIKAKELPSDEFFENLRRSELEAATPAEPEAPYPTCETCRESFDGELAKTDYGSPDSTRWCSARCAGATLEQKLEAAQQEIARLRELRKSVAQDLLKHINGEEYERSLAGLYALLTEDDEFSAAAQLKEK
jgi:hypothetical protein